MNEQYLNYIKALNHPSVPTLFLDFDAFKKNIEWVKKNAGGKKIRLASKSIRSKEVLKKILSSSDLFQGIMAYDLREALWLRDEGFKDILMGYPTVDNESLIELSKNPSEITLMVDLAAHLHKLESIASSKNCLFQICIDIDLSMDLPGLRFGVFRSRINDLNRMNEFLKELKQCPHLKLIGIMGYEAQIAGVMDKESVLIRGLKKLSIKKLRKRRQELIDLVRLQGHNLTIINGGGTGSLQSTREEQCITEITVGSGFFAPVCFDHYQDFTLSEALAFTLPIVRKPAEGIFTCFGGGYIASGSTDQMKQPMAYLPHGLKLLKHEGAGEVQTPVIYSGTVKLDIGDSLIFRHAKSGEVCERFKEIHLISNGFLQETVLTYRGEGKSFV